MKRFPIIDNFIARLLSRKLIVFVIATFGLFSDKLISTDWVIIASTYLAVEGGADIIERILKNKNNYE